PARPLRAGWRAPWWWWIRALPPCRKPATFCSPSRTAASAPDTCTPSWARSPVAPCPAARTPRRSRFSNRWDWPSKMWCPRTWRIAARSPPDAVCWFRNDGSAMTRFPLAILGGAAAIVLGLLCAKPLRHAAVPPRVTLEPAQLIADGYDTATLTIDENSVAPPRVVVEPPHAATVTEISAAPAGWMASIRAGVTPA